MFFSGAGSCPEGAFPCANSSLCIPQYSVCNKHVDCPLADDEDITCGRYNIKKDKLLSTLYLGSKYLFLNISK